jgi:carbon monoxide dehydrogenase subunit G
MDFTNTVTIDRRPQEVFRFVSDLENVPKWNYAIIETRKTSDGPVDVGTTYRQVRSAPTRSEEILRVTEFESGRRFAVQGDLGPFVGTLTYEFEDVDGRTRLTNTASLEAHGLMRIAAPIASGRIREAVAENLGALRQLMEERDTTPQ